MLSIVTNVDSLIAQQNLNVNSNFQSNTIQQLTSGYRINYASDDAAGLAQANQDRDNVAQLNQGVLNISDGIAALQTMDGAMSNISQMLDRMQTLATEASSADTGSTTTMNSEFQNVIGEIEREATNAGLSTTTLSVYTGGGASPTVAATLHTATATALGISTLTINTTAAAAIAAISAAIGKLGSAQGAVGAYENVLNYASQLAQSQISNTSSAESQLRDANVAQEAANLSKAQVMQQATIAAMAQANQEPQAVLALLKQ